jgi:hypothetical protein
MYYKLFLFIPVSILLSASDCERKPERKKNKNHREISLPEVKPGNRFIFEKTRSEYDTLIPIFDGLFITHSKRDSSSGKTSPLFIITSPDAHKWGVIDSSGNVIVPFICDGIKAINEKKGIASVYVNSYSLDTGLPRYMYFGKYFFFNKNGRTKQKEKSFNIRIELMNATHSENFVIESGPEYYLPKKYINSNSE